MHAKLFITLFLAAGLMARAALAQPDEAPPPRNDDDRDSDNDAGARTAPGQTEAVAPPEPTAPAQPAQAGPAAPALMRIRPGLSPWERQTGWFPSSTGLSFTGGLQTDVGYAKYTHDATTLNPEDFYDFRGRFVAGPVLRHDFESGKYFFLATGQMVGWLREQFGIYQVNVDDVYGQVGRYGVWDVQVGSFMMWRVYRKGLGFDLYTLEDTGALVNVNIESGKFHVHTYEASYLFFREQPGHAAFHFYPTEWSGIELGGVYGKDGTANTAGGRAAANVQLGIVSLSAAGEYRFSRPAVYPGSLDADNNFIACVQCGLVKRFGFGGGAVIAWKPIELGINLARGTHQGFAQKDGTPDKANFDTTTSVGGYLEVDVGSLTLRRPVIVGAGVNRTELLAEDGSFDRHVQSAGYLAVPLGFNNAMLKLVLSNADGHLETPAGTDPNGVPLFNAFNNKMFAGRVRLSFNF